MKKGKIDIVEGMLSYARIVMGTKIQNGMLTFTAVYSFVCSYGSFMSCLVFQAKFLLIPLCE